MRNRSYKVIIAGSRTATSENTYRLLEQKLDKILKNKSVTHDIVLVSGTDTYGKRAGYLRNETMAQNADALVALWDGKSRGTRHMLNIAKECGLPSRTIYTNHHQ